MKYTIIRQHLSYKKYDFVAICTVQESKSIQFVNTTKPQFVDTVLFWDFQLYLGC